MLTDNPRMTAKSPTIFLSNNRFVLALLWLIVFILYIPTARAGLVGDFPGWVEMLESNSFWDYINRKGSKITSLYQFTQTVTYLFYQVFGTHAWPWHLLYVTMQAVNAWLLFIVCKRLFNDSGINNAAQISLGGTLLFCVCPHISEVVVWEPSYHYLQGFMLILVIIYLLQNFLYQQKTKYAIWGAVLFFLSTYSLEVFYLTIPFTMLFISYYRYGLSYDNKVIRKALLYFLLPQLALFTMHMIVLWAVYHSPFAHIGSNAVQPLGNYLCKLPKYIFHILFFGRYFSHDFRHEVYAWSENRISLFVLYSLLSVICIYILVRFRQMASRQKATSLMFFFSLVSLSILTPIWFPDTFHVIYDRYTYILDAFIYMTLSLLISFIAVRFISVSLWSMYALVCVFFTLKVNIYWYRSASIVNNLLDTFPDPGGKDVLLLNLPECFNGAQMIGTRDEGEFRIMYNTVRHGNLDTNVYDVVASNYISQFDGAHVNVANDSTIKVTLNQWGTWWMHFGFGANSRENSSFRLEMKDVGHWYDIILKKSADQYLLLYVVGDQWKVVDMNKKGVDQN